MHLIVLPMEDGVYRVSYHKKLLADLYTEITAAAGEVERACCSFDSLSW
ncbi:hypothetical protein HDF26_002343 [Pedobacter cryoconitis]|nr:hypothetical protein [Pedobacter cryoconitis]MBB6271886.1 hypothetical protein [Pedobacter cryoconitis]